MDKKIEKFIRLIIEDIKLGIGKPKRSSLFEELFLKKDQKDRKLYIFSDIEDNRKRSQETYRLGPEFGKRGFIWDPISRHWVGSYDRFRDITEFIKKYNKIRDIVEELDDIEDFVADIDIEQSKKNIIMANLEQYITDLTNAVSDAAMSAEINRYLTFFSKFHKYSLTNTWLIYLQKPDATRVAGYNKWKELGRGVKKGATSISIWVPMNVKNKEEISTDDDEDVNSPSYVTRFKMGTVFDISDTYPLSKGGEIPEEPKWFDNNTPSDVADELSERLIKFAEEIGIKITKEQAKGGEKGYSAGGHINLTSNVSGVAQASVLVHELAHELLHWKKSSPFYSDDPETKGRDVKELQAESVSYIVLKHYGLPVNHHPTYLVLWKANKDKIMKNMKIITSCAKYIINGVDDLT